MPMVVPQLKTITWVVPCRASGVESTSLRLGTPHESVLSMDILTGDGRAVTVTRTRSTRRCTAASRTPTVPSATVAHDRAGAGQAVRAPAALPVRAPGRCCPRTGAPPGPELAKQAG